MTYDVIGAIMRERRYHGGRRARSVRSETGRSVANWDASPRRQGKATNWVLVLVVLGLAIALFGPASGPVMNSGPLPKVSAAEEIDHLRFVIRARISANQELPRDAVAFREMVSRVAANTRLERAILDFRDLAPGVVILQLDVPPEGPNGLRYEHLDGDVYEISEIYLDKNGEIVESP